MKKIKKPEMIVVGIECLTSNAVNKGPIDIPKHWAKFYQEGIFDKIPHRASDEVVALYCDYEGDHTQPYSLVIGCPTHSFSDIPQGMVVKIVPSGFYASFPVRGDYPQALIEVWGDIWQMDLKRSYTGDYEIYPTGFHPNGPLNELHILIALIDQGIGFAPKGKRVLHHDLDFLAGTSSAKQSKTFENNIQFFEKVDEELWL